MELQDAPALIRIDPASWAIGQARDGNFDSFSAYGRPPAPRLRRPASGLRGLPSAISREAGLHAVDGSFCPVPQGRDEIRRSAKCAGLATSGAVHIRLLGLFALFEGTLST